MICKSFLLFFRLFIYLVDNVFWRTNVLHSVKFNLSIFSILPYTLFFGKEDWPRANIFANLPLFCMWDTNTAWLDKWCIGLHPVSEPMDPRLPKWRVWTQPLCHWAGPLVLIVLFSYLRSHCLISGQAVKIYPCFSCKSFIDFTLIFRYLFCQCNLPIAILLIEEINWIFMWAKLRIITQEGSLHKSGNYSREEWFSVQFYTFWEQRTSIKHAQDTYSSKFQRGIQLQISMTTWPWCPGKGTHPQEYWYRCYPY